MVKDIVVVFFHDVMEEKMWDFSFNILQNEKLLMQ